MVMVYEVFEMTFGLFVTALSPNPKFAGLVLVFLVTTFNWFNGVVVPYSQIQVFWRYWVCVSVRKHCHILVNIDPPVVLFESSNIPLRGHDYSCQQ